MMRMFSTPRGSLISERWSKRILAPNPRPPMYLRANFSPNGTTRLSPLVRSTQAILW